MTFEQLSKLILSFTEEREWEQFHSPRSLILALMGELGELAELVQWVDDGALDAKWIDTQRQELSMELADIQIYLIRLSQVLDLDLLTAVEKKIELNADRYPVEVARGSSRKYSQSGVSGEGRAPASRK